MLNGVWGHKIGMTQIFSGDTVVPVTAINAGNWIITGLKTKERDGYNAIQVGCMRARYSAESFSTEWLKNLKTYFLYTKEIKCKTDVNDVAVGNSFDPLSVIAEGDIIHVSGKSKGLGFAGVVKRHGFNGPPGSHGSTMGKRPGTSGSLRRCGKVIKGKKFPGRAGGLQHTLKNLTVAKVGLESGSVFLVRGSVPGKSGALLFIRKA
ncbi:MAG TPA: 50S ribosomal protein L3 [Candidatus Babeliales bacterium]|jgi:large subunit ribosomal protein L3|nr:50S ribosomal protein L3 [Candidatus Babeliales bacterium]